MFSTARRKAKKLIDNGKSDEHAEISIKPEALPESCTLSQLQTELILIAASDTKEQILETILVLQASLQSLSREAGDEEHITALSIWVSKSILPDGAVISHSDIHIPSESDTAKINNSIKLIHRLANHGLRTLAILLSLSTHSTALPASVLLAPIAYVSRDAFTTPLISRLAITLLSSHRAQTTSPEFLVIHILQNIIRPLFSKSRPATITSSGRRAAFVDNEPLRRFDLEAEKRDKGWKYQDVWAVSILEWTVSNASVEIITQSWNLFIPPLLTLIDDPSTPIRSRGLSMLSNFLPKFSQKLLLQTGLGGVFEDAISPTLLFLPNVTPVEESCVLLPAAYDALEVLGSVWFCRDGERREEGKTGKEGSLDKKEKEQSDKDKRDKDRTKFLDKVMRKGIVAGWFHAREYPDIVDILLEQVGKIVGEMGIHSVKHLKDIIPMISTALVDPFTTFYLLHTALAALSSTIQNSWPRISEPVHRRAILMALAVCWKNQENPLDGGGYKISETSEKRPRGEMKQDVSLEDVKRELREVGRLFITVVQAQVDMKTELEPLFEAQPGLKSVLQIDV